MPECTKIRHFETHKPKTFMFPILQFWNLTTAYHANFHAVAVNKTLNIQQLSCIHNEKTTVSYSSQAYVTECCNRQQGMHCTHWQSRAWKCHIGSALKTYYETTEAHQLRTPQICTVTLKIDHSLHRYMCKQMTFMTTTWMEREILSIFNIIL